MKAKLMPIACAASAVRCALVSASCAAMHGATAATASRVVAAHSIPPLPAGLGCEPRLNTQQPDTLRPDHLHMTPHTCLVFEQ